MKGKKMGAKPIPKQSWSASLARRLLHLFAVSGLLTVACVAQGQTYPSKPVRVVLQYPVGGPSDTLARIVFTKVQERLGQPFVIEARSGAGGTLGTDFVAKATPDGYTLLLSASGPLAISPWIQKSLPYDPLKNLAPVVLVAAVPLVLVTRKDLPARTVQEFISLLKANPGKYSYGSSGNGTPQHLSAALFESMAEVNVLHVPYRGQAPMATDLMGGQVDFAIDSLISSQANLATGRLTPLAVTSTTPVPLLPGVPTLAESGLVGYESLAWYGVVAPAGTPGAVIERLNREIRAVLDLPDIRAQIEKLGSAPVHGSADQFSAFIRAEHAKWGAIVRRYKISAD